MKIGIDIRTLMDAQYSGVSEYTLNLLREIFRQDQENEYILFYNSGHDISTRMPRFDFPNVKIVASRYPNKLFNNIMQRILQWPKIDQKLGVDLFFVPNIGFISLSKNCKKIITIHDLSFLRYGEFFSWKRRLWHQLINVKKIVKSFDFIIAVSENTKRDLIELCGVPEEKIQVIYSGIGEEFRVYRDLFFEEAKNPPNPLYQGGNIQSPPDKGDLGGLETLNNAKTFFIKAADIVKKKYSLPEKFIFFLGTIEPRKNIAGLIRAYNQFRDENPALADHKLVLAGGHGWKFKNIFQEFEKSKYREDIIWLNYIDASDKPFVYNLAQVFVYPSFYEGFGFPPLEAMACGVPVIVSNSSSLPEVVGDAGIMVTPNNPAEIKVALQNILTNQEFSELLVKRGLENVEKFKWSKCARQYLEIFKK